MELGLPHISDELLAYMERLYQDKAPDIDASERQIWVNRGEVGVLRHFRRLHSDQRENMLTGNIK